MSSQDRRVSKQSVHRRYQRQTRTNLAVSKNPSDVSRVKFLTKSSLKIHILNVSRHYRVKCFTLRLPDSQRLMVWIFAQPCSNILVLMKRVERQTDKQLCRQINRETDRQISIYVYLFVFIYSGHIWFSTSLLVYCILYRFQDIITYLRKFKGVT